MTIYYIDDAVQQRAVVIPSGVEGLGKKVTIKII
jgi:hypothetical protein